MSDVANPLATVRRMAVAIPLWCVCFHVSDAICPEMLMAQQADVPSLKLTPSQEGAAREKRSERKGSTTSFNLDRRQSVIQCVEVIQQFMDRKDYLSVFPLLETMLSDSSTFVPITLNTEVTAFEFVKRTLERIPAEPRARFEALRRTSASDAWDRAKQGGIEEVSLFLRQYAESPLAAEAWWWIGSFERDHGHFRRAAAAFRNVAEHPESSPSQRVIAFVAAVESLRRIASGDEILAVHRQLLSMDQSLRLEIAGRRLTLGDWLVENAVNSERDLKDQQVIEEKEASAQASWRQHRPVLLPIWRHDLPNSPQTSLDKLTRILPDPSARPVSINGPMICGTKVIVRTTEDIHAFEIASGKPEWVIPNTEFLHIGKRTFENTAYQSVAIEWAQRRTQADSIFSRMTTNGEHLYVIQEPDRASEFRKESDSSRGLPRVGPQFNQLCSYQLKSGALEWAIGGPLTESPQGLEGYFFLGTPLVLDDELFVIAQRESDLLLLSLGMEQGLLNWSILLGNASRPIDEDLLRSRTACVMVFHGGLLLCSTSSGVIVAVDPMMRSLKWSYRYPATTVSASDMAQMTKRGGRPHHFEPWWESWREPFIAVSQIRALETGPDSNQSTKQDAPISVLLFASPESESLHAVRLPDGLPLWQLDRDDGLTVSGVAAQRIIVTEDEYVRAHELRTGNLVWKTAIGQTCGPAVLTGSIVVVPSLSGGTTLLDVNDGKVLTGATANDAPLGVLAETEEGWIAFNRQTIALLPQLADVRKSIANELKQDPSNESLLVRAALLDLQAGEIQSAREHLIGLNSSPARDLRRQALIAALESYSSETTESNRTNLARELNELADNSDYKFAAAAAIGMSALAVEDLVDTVDACLNGLSANLGHHDSLVKRQLVHVRKDRVLLGLIEEAYRRAKPIDKSALDELFQARLNKARKSRDRFALQELWAQWRGLDWSRRIVVADEEKVLRKRNFVETELRLRDAAGCEDQNIATQAAQQLAERLDRQGLRQDAVALRRHFAREHRAPKDQENQPNSDSLTSETKPVPTEPREVAVSLSQTAWPPTQPTIGSRNDRNFGIYAPLIPLHAQPGSLAERLDIAIDRTGDEVYFRGESFFQAGQDEDHERRFTLPKTTSPFRGPGGYMLREGWGIGRIVVLLVGSELFAVAPLDEKGEPNSRFLWANSIDLELPFGETEEALGRKGVYGNQRTILDQTQQPLIAVGPVRAGYLCYHQGKRLVAVDTETGRDLWQRLDVPADAKVLGDDHRVYAWMKNGSVDVFSAIDGRYIEKRELNVLPENLVHQQGALAWTATVGTTIQLALHDLGTGQTIWSRTDYTDSLIAVLDSETLAVVHPDGHLSILDAKTAEPRCEPLIVKAESMREIVAWNDSENWYLALSRTVQNLEALKAPQPRDSYRQRFINGPLYAVKRSDPRILWQRELKNEPLALDLARTAPVIVQLWKLKPRGSNDASEGMLRVIDKRTGKSLIERRSVDVLPYFLLNPDPQQGMLELKLTQETITLNYAEDSKLEAHQTPEKEPTDPAKKR